MGKEGVSAAGGEAGRLQGFRYLSALRFRASGGHKVALKSHVLQLVIPQAEASPAPEELADDDWRKNNPRFTEGNLEQNLRIVNEVKAVASQLDATPAQIALAWLLAQGDDIAPIRWSLYGAPWLRRRLDLDEKCDRGARQASRPDRVKSY